MTRMNNKKLKKTVSIAIGLIIAFFANEWFKQALAQPTEIGKWILILVALTILIVIIYFNLDEKGNF